MRNYEFGIKLKFDGKEVDTGVTVSREQLAKLGIEVDKAGKKAADSLDQIGMSAKATAAAMRNVPAQFTDIVTALQAGQAPLTVLMQQGGQLKDMFGGVGPAAKALGNYIGALVTPTTATAAAVGALTYAFITGAKEQETFARTLIMSGNVSATTAGQMQAMAAQVAASTGATRGLAAESLNELVASGAVSVDMLMQVSRAAIDLERVGGPAVSETAKQFAALGNDPVKASLKLNEQTHYLTAAVYEQIKALADQGRNSEAASLAQSAYADAVERRIPALKENLGGLERAWLAVSSGAKSAWDSMLNIGRQESLEGKLAAVENAIEKAKNPNQIDNGEVGLATLEKQRTVLRQMVDDQNRMNFRIAEANVERESGLARQVKTEDLRTKYQTKEQKHEKEILDINMSNLSVDEKRNALAMVEAAYAEKKKAAAKGLSPYDSALIARHEDYVRMLKEADAESKELAKANQGYAKAVDALLSPLEKEADALELQIKNYGLTRAEIDATAVSRLEEATAQAALNGASDEALSFLQRELELRRRIAAASADIAAKKADEQLAKDKKKAFIDAEKAIADERLKGWQETDRVARDVFTALTDSGESASKRIGNTLRKALLSAVYEATAKPIAFQLYTSVTGALGMPAVDSKSSSTGDLGNLFLTGNSLYAATSGGGLYGAFAKSGIGQALGLSSASVGGVAGSAGVMGGSLASGAGVMGGSVALGAGGLELASASVGGVAGSAGVMGGSVASEAGVMGGSVASGAGGLELTGLGAALPWVGGALALGSAFGLFGGKAPPSSQAYVTSQLKDNKYSVLGATSGNGDKYNAALYGPAEAIGKSVTSVIGGLYSSLGKDLDLTFGSSVHTRGDGKQYSGFDGSINGTAIGAQSWTYGKISSEEAYKQALEHALSDGVVAAIKASDLSAAFKSVFDSLSGSTQITTMVNNYAALSKSTENLATNWGITTDQALAAAKAISATGDELVANVGSMAQAMAQSQGQALEAEYKKLTASFNALAGSGLPTTLTEFDAAMKSVDTSTQAGITTFGKLFALRAEFAAFTSAVDALKKGVGDSVFSLRTDSAQYSILTANLDSAAKAAGVSAPTTAEALVALADGIDYTTTAGITLAANLPNLVSAFNAVNAVAVATAQRTAEQRANLQDSLDKSLGNTQKLRERELAALEPSNRALQQRLYILADAANTETTSAAAATSTSSALDTAMSALQRAVSAEKTRLETAYTAQANALRTAADAAGKVQSSITSLADTLGRAVKTVVIGSDEQTLQRRIAAQSSLDSILSVAQSGGSLVDYGDQISAAIDDLSKPSENLYESFVDYARAQGRANGTLAALNQQAKAQKSVADLTLSAINDSISAAATQHTAELSALDDTLTTAQSQLDALQGIDNSVLSVAEAVRRLASAMGASQTSTASSTSVSTASSTSVSTATSTAGKQTDVLLSVGGKASFVSSTGAVWYGDTVTTNSGWTGSLAAAKQALTDGIAATTPEKFRAGLVAEGISSAMVDALFGMPAGTSANWAKDNGLQAFRRGGVASPGMYLAGDDGPELITSDYATRIYPADQTSMLMSRLNSPETGMVAVVGIVQRLCSVVEKQTERLAAIERAAAKTADLLDSNSAGGGPLLVQMA